VKKEADIGALVAGEADAATAGDPGEWRRGEVCYDCGRRGHDHFNCPGVVGEPQEPKDWTVYYYSEAMGREVRMGNMGLSKARLWAVTMNGRIEEAK
jgi:hypothetical protein